MSALAVAVVEELNTALIQFGERAFFDRGPGELLDVRDIAEQFELVGVEAAVEAFRALLELDRFGVRLASGILYHLQGWDELWAQHGEFLESFF